MTPVFLAGYEELTLYLYTIHTHCFRDVEPTVVFLLYAPTELFFQLGVACCQQLSDFVSRDS